MDIVPLAAHRHVMTRLVEEIILHHGHEAARKMLLDMAYITSAGNPGQGSDPMTETADRDCEVVSLDAFRSGKPSQS